MGFFVEDPSQIVSHLLYKTAVLIAVSRWIWSWALRFRNIDWIWFWISLSSDPDQIFSSSSSPPPVPADAIRESLVLATFEDVKHRLPWVSDTCAVCLGQLAEADEVRELRNCCHVFHRECIDRWVDHDHDRDQDDNHKTCPLCRAPLLTSSQALGWPRNEPSWAVERLLYLFGDDLLL